jgi:hypothetical protein
MAVLKLQKIRTKRSPFYRGIGFFGFWSWIQFFPKSLFWIFWSGCGLPARSPIFMRSARNAPLLGPDMIGECRGC